MPNALCDHLSLKMGTNIFLLQHPFIFGRVVDKVGVVDQDALEQSGGTCPTLRDSLSQ